MTAPKQSWDSELYEAKHAFVWQLAEGVFDLLAPQPGERILDVGCGTGQLTSKIDAVGASVVGIDLSPAMIGQARQNYPHMTFSLQDVTKLSYDGEFDAVFSNATLHWVLDAESAVRAMARALKPGGRLVAEFGGVKNVQLIELAVRAAVARYAATVPPSLVYFPSIGEYTPLLERANLEVRLAQLFDRPTPLDGPQGMENWIEQFAAYYFETLPRSERKAAIADAVELLRPTSMRDGTWFADYRRLRIMALKA